MKGKLRLISVFDARGEIGQKSAGFFGNDVLATTHNGYQIFLITVPIGFVI